MKTLKMNDNLRASRNGTHLQSRLQNLSLILSNHSLGESIFKISSLNLFSTEPALRDREMLKFGDLMLTWMI